MKKTEPRNEHLPCDAPDCTKATVHGIVLHRVNPREEPAVYMCKDHTIETIKAGIDPEPVTRVRLAGDVYETIQGVEDTERYYQAGGYI